MHPSASPDATSAPRAQHRVDESVLERGRGGEDPIAVGVGAQLCDRAAAVPGEDLLHIRAHPHHLVGREDQVGIAPRDCPAG